MIKQVALVAQAYRSVLKVHVQSLQHRTCFFQTALLVVFVKGDRNLKLKLAVFLTSQWYYLITLLAVKQYYTSEERGQELDMAYTLAQSSAGVCLSAQ